MKPEELCIDLEEMRALCGDDPEKLAQGLVIRQIAVAAIDPLRADWEMRVAIATALRQSSEEGERRGREEAAKVAERHAAAHGLTGYNIKTDIAAVIRSLNSPSPSKEKN